MSVKRRFSTRWGHPYHLQGACTECRQTLLHPLCSITPMTLESYTEYSAQSKREDTSGPESMPKPSASHRRHGAYGRQGKMLYYDLWPHSSVSALKTHIGKTLWLVEIRLRTRERMIAQVVVAADDI